MKTNLITRIAIVAVLMFAFSAQTFAQDDNREWWNSLSPAWKKVFRDQELKGKDVEPTDEQLAMIVLCENMECGGNKGITDLKPLKRLTNLTMLDCSNTSIKSLDGIQYLTGLKTLDCSNNDNLNSLEFIAGLVNLESVNCGNTMVKSHRSHTSKNSVSSMLISAPSISSAPSANSKALLTSTSRKTRASSRSKASRSSHSLPSSIARRPTSATSSPSRI